MYFSQIHGGKHFLIETKEDDNTKLNSVDYKSQAKGLLTKQGFFKPLNVQKHINKHLCICRDIPNFVFIEISAVLDALPESGKEGKKVAEAYKEMDTATQHKIQKKIRSAYGEDLDAVS